MGKNDFSKDGSTIEYFKDMTQIKNKVAWITGGALVLEKNLP